MRTLSLFASASVTLDVNGNGQVTLGPNIPGAVWAVTGVTCQTSTDNNTPVFEVYLNSVAQSNFVGGSQTGNNDTASGDVPLIYPGMTLVGVWTGGDTGAVATMNLTGTKTVP